MSIILFTDFGSADIYVGQVKVTLHQHAPGVPVIDLLHDAPNFNVKAGAHLLAALVSRVPPDSVTLAVIDPGVGGARDAIVVNADSKWFVGPDNGLMSVLAARARTCAYWRVTWRPEAMSMSFHGRELFAPIAAAIASGEFPAGMAESADALKVTLGAGDLAEIIYVDHYGNAATGLRASGMRHDAQLMAGGHLLNHARVFSAVAAGEVFWYENSLGLVEIAGNACSAAAKLGLSVGQSVSVCA